jgi:hypothetical protein
MAHRAHETVHLTFDIAPLLSRIKAWHCGLAVGGVFLAIGLSELRHHGLVLDAPSLYYAGDRTFYWLTHLGSSSLDFYAPPPAGFQTIFKPYPEVWDLIHYPVFPDLIASATSRVFATGLGWLHPVQAHNLGLVLLHSAALFFYTVLAWELLGPLAGAVAGICYLFYPSVLGHAFNNPKDLPCADFYACGLLAGALAVLRPIRGGALVAGVFFGLALSCKMNAAVGLATWLAWGGALFLIRLWRKRVVDFRLIRTAVVTVAVALFVFVVLWPWLYSGTTREGIGRLSEYWRFYADYAGGPRRTWTDYPLRSLVTMTPPVVLVLAALYLVEGLRTEGTIPDGRAVWALLVFWTFIPILRIALPHSNFYDANRHFIEYAGGLCAMAGGGAAAFAQLVEHSRLRSDRSRTAILSIGALALAIGLLLPWWSYRPYEASYYNFLIGGLGGAQRRALNVMFPPHDHRVLGSEGDYWYSSVADADRDLGRLVRPGDTVGVCGPPYPTMQMQWFGPGPIPPVALPDVADYVYVSPREAFCNWSHARKLEELRPVLVRVERGGGLIYEIVGPPSSPHEATSPHNAYEDLKLQ